jgi:DNA-binding protein Fis
MPSFYEELVTKLTNPKKQKPYKESSVKPVYQYLKNLNGGEAPASLDFLLDRPMVLRFLQNYAVSTQRTIVFAIRNIAKDFERDDILEVWKENIEETESGKGLPEMKEKSEAQAKAYALLEGDDKGNAWGSVLKKVEANTSPAGDLKYIVPRLYTMFPPRRNLDYTEMKLTTDYSPEMSKEFNYLVVSGDKKIEMRFVFNRYKTDGNYHQKIFDVPDDLVECLKHYIKATDRKEGEFLLNLRNGKKLRSDDITDTLHKVIGSGVSTQMLRHMYLDKYNTPEREDVIKEMMGDAEKMSHSISTQQGIYVKN